MAALAGLSWHDDAQHMTSVGSAVQTYFLYDGPGSTTDLTDGSASPTDAYSYDVFGTIRSQSGSSENGWLFAGERL